MVAAEEDFDDLESGIEELRMEELVAVVVVETEGKFFIIEYPFCDMV